MNEQCQDCKTNPAKYTLTIWESFNVDDIETEETISEYNDASSGSFYQLCRTCIDKRGSVYLDEPTTKQSIGKESEKN